jgi:hypothetical protein
MQSYEPIPDVVLSNSVADVDAGATAQFNGAPAQNPPPFDYCITTALCTCEYLCYMTAAVTALCGMCR